MVYKKNTNVVPLPKLTYHMGESLYIAQTDCLANHRYEEPNSETNVSRLEIDLKLFYIFVYEVNKYLNGILMKQY